MRDPGGGEWKTLMLSLRNSKAAKVLMLTCFALAGCRQNGESSPGATVQNADSPRSADKLDSPSRKAKDSPMKTELATFAAGCFWGVELEFSNIPGVIKTTVGYTGGKTAKPTYEQVCSHTTGHAEAVLVEFDPTQVSYDKLLDNFWAIHDPTQMNRQGPDVGDQYRSAIFYHSPAQEKAARASLERQQNSGREKGKIVTQVVPAVEFHAAEDYHQQYFTKRGQKSCHIRRW